MSSDLVNTIRWQPQWGSCDRRVWTSFAMGGGFEIALACHLVVAEQSAVFTLSEVKVGLIAGAVELNGYCLMIRGWV